MGVVSNPRNVFSGSEYETTHTAVLPVWWPRMLMDAAMLNGW